MNEPWVKLKFDNEPDVPDWHEYASCVESSFKSLLDSEPQESAVHDFLERHPCMLPSADGAFSRGHHGVMTGVVVSKPLLPGARPLYPDFMYVAMDSTCVFPVLIEIEAPSKRHATQAGIATAQLTQARAQLAEWATWFSEPANEIAFRDHYDIRADMLRVRKLRPRFLLVYGRRADALSNPRFAKTRVGTGGQEMKEMTYDRLTASEDMAGAVVVRPDTTSPGEFRFRVVQVSPMVDARSIGFLDTPRIVGLREALDAQSALSPERRAWLLDRAGGGREDGRFAHLGRDQYDDDEMPD